MPVSLVTLPHHPSLKDLQGREQRRSAVALIVMRHGSATALLQRQTRLGAIQCLNLALFIDAQHHRLLWRIQVLTPA
jgi:hypothetical protein